MPESAGHHRAGDAGADGDPSPGDWFVAVGEALTGEALRVPDEAAQVGPDAVTAWLDAEGWSAHRLQQHRAEVRATGRPWPHVPASGLGPGTAARLQALVAGVRELTGTSGLVRTQRSQESELGPGAQRLLAEVPPHHGSV